MDKISNQFSKLDIPDGHLHPQYLINSAWGNNWSGLTISGEKCSKPLLNDIKTSILEAKQDGNLEIKNVTYDPTILQKYDGPKAVL